VWHVKNVKGAPKATATSNKRTSKKRKQQPTAHNNNTQHAELVTAMAAMAAFIYLAAGSKRMPLPVAARLRNRQMAGARGRQ
jgi:hypothetical protein